ncbi:MAG: glycogen debranching protein GlgX [Burkholderiaceae bacterium]
MSPLDIGRAWPLGAQVDGDGVNFAIVSAHATAVELCLFDGSGRVEERRMPLPGRRGDVWHGRLPAAGAGLVYGWRAHGPWAPECGHRYNPAKLLLDPYAREIVGRFEWDDSHRGADPADAAKPDPRDNGALALKARVVDDAYDWNGDVAPATPLADTLLYELQVKGYTQRHPQVPAALRGRYAGLASDASIAHLHALGITAVSLLPVHQHLDEERLVAFGLRNYWGYNTIGYFCPDPVLSGATDGRGVRDEFRAMVKRLHAARIEVILDVVYNHTAESDETGPTISWRGLDNAGYYRLNAGDPTRYENHTGCGNTLDLRHPRVIQMVLDSLRYWVLEMHVDGFRFDLAPVLGRTDVGYSPHAPFFTALAQDPVLAGVKLIAEPWDVGPGGYRLGQFPDRWAEWNDRFRDSMRGYWLGQAAVDRIDRGEFARRLCASSDIFHTAQRLPAESVNFIVAHDGYTLHDLVSFEQRHNEANLEGNRDGHGHNRSWNCGVEGPSDDPAVHALRQRLQRALLATLLVAQGTPMLVAGDELGHSQGGNNNPYCQDNPTTWIDWAGADADLLAYTRRLIALRREVRGFRNAWYRGVAGDDGLHDVSWCGPDGGELDATDWHATEGRVLGCLIGHPAGSATPLLLLFNPEPVDRPFRLPDGTWHALLDSSQPTGANTSRDASVAVHPLAARSVCVLRKA